MILVIKWKDLREFSGVSGKSDALKVGDVVEVYLERVENSKGEAVVSREKARREEASQKNSKKDGINY